jgi:hypothetical protein
MAVRLFAVLAISALPYTAAAQDAPNVKAALTDAFKMLAIEHGIRIAFQPKTRHELAGPFWKDYRESLHVPRSWEDTDAWYVNYVGHPIHGAAAGWIWIAHDPVSRREEFGLSGKYWATRGRAVAWIAGYSLQFEIGPLSEASIGNVGKRPETTAWVDYVVTPVGGFGILVAEDALDRYFIKWVEARTTNRVWRASLRMLFNPARTMANVSANRVPWHRDTRRLAW